MSSPKYEDYLSKLWYDPKRGYSGPQKLYQIVKKEGKFKIGRGKIKQWLQNQDPYSVSRNTVYRFPRSRYVVDTIDSLWEMDLADVGNIHKHNNGYKFLLVVIDVFSKYLWVEALKDKTHTSVLKSLKKILSGPRSPVSIRSDLGKEFRNRFVKEFLVQKGISITFCQGDTKCSIVERVIRSFRNILFRYFRHRQSYKYIDVLQDITDNYNNRPHRSLGSYSPSEVNRENASEVRLSAYFARNPQTKRRVVKKEIKKKAKKKKSKYKLKVGDLVRITYKRYTFQRDYQQKWTEELFKIRRRYMREDKPIYLLKDLQDEAIEGSFYQPELQKVRKDEKNTAWKIEKIIKKRKRNGTTEALVRWLGYPKKFDSWIPMSDIQNE